MTEVDVTPRSRPEQMGSLADALGHEPEPEPRRGLARVLQS
jgi:hypothetical protein